jgi:hypothetical protein
VIWRIGIFDPHRVKTRFGVIRYLLFVIRDKRKALKYDLLDLGDKHGAEFKALTAIRDQLLLFE